MLKITDPKMVERALALIAEARRLSDGVPPDMAFLLGFATLLFAATQPRPLDAIQSQIEILKLGADALKAGAIAVAVSPAKVFS